MKRFLIMALIVMVLGAFLPQQADAGGRCNFVGAQQVGFVNTGNNVAFLNARGTPVRDFLFGPRVAAVNVNNNVAFLNARGTPVRDFLFGPRFNQNAILAEQIRQAQIQQLLQQQALQQQFQFQTASGYVQPQFLGLNPGFVDPSIRFLRTGATLLSIPQLAFIGSRNVRLPRLRGPVFPIFRGQRLRGG